MTHPPPARQEDLPASLLDVAEALGLRVALRLMAEFGGRDVKFPRRPDEDHPVARALGMDDALALCEFLGGAQIYVPHGRPRRSSRPAVLDMQARGLGRAEISRALGLSERHVRYLANQAPPAPLPLFPDET